MFRSVHASKTEDLLARNKLDIGRAHFSHVLHKTAPKLLLLDNLALLITKIYCVSRSTVQNRTSSSNRLRVVLQQLRFEQDYNVRRTKKD